MFIVGAVADMDRDGGGEPAGYGGVGRRNRRADGGERRGLRSIVVVVAGHGHIVVREGKAGGVGLVAADVEDTAIEPGRAGKVKGGGRAIGKVVVP